MQTFAGANFEVNPDARRLTETEKRKFFRGWLRQEPACVLTPAVSASFRRCTMK